MGVMIVAGAEELLLQGQLRPRSLPMNSPSFEAADLSRRFVSLQAGRTVHLVGYHL
jgi:hypothetical protein